MLSFVLTYATQLWQRMDFINIRYWLNRFLRFFFFTLLFTSKLGCCKVAGDCSWNFSYSCRAKNFGSSKIFYWKNWRNWWSWCCWCSREVFSYLLVHQSISFSVCCCLLFLALFHKIEWTARFSVHGFVFNGILFAIVLICCVIMFMLNRFIIILLVNLLLFVFNISDEMNFVNFRICYGLPKILNLFSF